MEFRLLAGCPVKRMCCACQTDTTPDRINTAIANPEKLFDEINFELGDYRLRVSEELWSPRHPLFYCQAVETGLQVKSGRHPASLVEQCL